MSTSIAIDVGQLSVSRTFISVLSVRLIIVQRLTFVVISVRRSLVVTRVTSQLLVSALGPPLALCRLQ